MRKKVVAALIAVTLLSMSTLAFHMPTASAQQTKIYVNPPTIKDVAPSENFTVFIVIENVLDLYGFDIQLRWDPSIIHCVGWELHVPVEDYPDGVLHETAMVIKNVVDESASIPGSEPGAMGWWAATSLAPAEPFSGNGTVVTLTFQVVGQGSCKIEFVRTSSTPMLTDPNGSPIPFEAYDAIFSNYVPPPVTVMLSPQKIVDPTLTPNSTFSVNVTTSEVFDLYSFKFQIDFNGSVISAENVIVNELFPPDQTTVEIYESKVLVAASLGENPTISGNITLATIDFYVKGIGETILDLNNVSLTNGIGEKLPINEPIDGYFNNILMAIIAISPETLINPSLTPGSIFTINVTLQNAIDLYGYTFNVYYDTNVLSCIGIRIIPLSNDTHYNVKQNVNDVEGLVLVDMQYYPPAQPISIYQETTITIITFQVQSYGQTLLDLFNTSLRDPENKEIIHEEKDGFFATLIRDVAIISLEITRNAVYPGEQIEIHAVAMNRGNMTAETFNVTLYCNETLIDMKTVTLNPWTNTTLTFVLNTTGLLPCSNYTVSVEALPVPYEINLSNNICSGLIKIKMIGDINGDNKIDILDLTIAASCYQSHKGDENWNPEADIAPPFGIIDIYDIVSLASKYGETCP